MKERLAEHIKAIESINMYNVSKVVNTIVSALQEGNKIFIIGNGVSASISQQFAIQMINKVKIDRDALQFIDLTSNAGVITSLADDYSFDMVFSRQLESLAVKGDVVIAISVSGRSQSIKIALETARNLGCYVISILGDNEGVIGPVSDLLLDVKSTNPLIVSETQLFIINMICEEVENKLFGEYI